MTTPPAAPAACPRRPATVMASQHAAAVQPNLREMVALGPRPEPLQVYKPTPALTQWASSRAATQSPQTVPQLFRQSVSQFGDRPFLGQNVNGHYEYTTYAAAQQQSEQVASALLDLGMQPGDRVGIVAPNSPEWMVASLGVHQAGCVDTPIFAQSSANDIRYALQDSQARVVVVGNEAEMQKVVSVEKDLPFLHTIVCLEPTQEASSKRVVTWKDFQAAGAASLPANRPAIDRRIDAQSASDIATIVYTSGSTGAAKGTMLMHGNLVSAVDLAGDRLQPQPNDVEMSLLPLSHVFERTVSYAILKSGAGIAYGRGPSTFAQDVQQAKPTVLPLVPQVYEKVRSGVEDNLAKSPGWKQKVFAWGTGVGRQYAAASRESKVSPWLSAEHRVAQKAVLDKLLGGHARLLLSGGAPLRADLGEYFEHLGLPPIINGYGMTEAVPIAFDSPDHPAYGTVGKPLGLDVRLADDGEIVVRGPNVMNGYLGKPEATAEAIDADGWLHTGDIGQFDADGNLRITDRKKSQLCLATGTKFFPGPVEGLLETSPFVSHAVLVGEGRPFTGALMVPDFDHLRPWARNKGLLTGDEPSSPEALAQSNAALSQRPEVAELLTQEVARTTGSLSYEGDVARPRQLAVLPHDFSDRPTGPDGKAELTALQKIVRPVIVQHYAPQIDELYTRKRQV